MKRRKEYRGKYKNRTHSTEDWRSSARTDTDPRRVRLPEHCLPIPMVAAASPLAVDYLRDSLSFFFLAQDTTSERWVALILPSRSNVKSGTIEIKSRFFVPHLRTDELRY